MASFMFAKNVLSIVLSMFKKARPAAGRVVSVDTL
jgi:hypothetical protein